jgi:hypothetical protein
MEAAMTLEQHISKHVIEKMYREGKTSPLEYKISIAALQRVIEKGKA